MSRFAFLAVVRLVIRRLELDAEESGKVLADDEESKGAVFSDFDGAGSETVDGGDSPRFAKSRADNVSTGVTGEGDHGVISSDDSLGEVTSDVVSDTIFRQVGHATALIPKEEVVESSAVVDGAPDSLIFRSGVVVTRSMLKANILVNTIPKHLSGILSNEIAKEEHHRVILNGSDRGSMFDLAVI